MTTEIKPTGWLPSFNKLVLFSPEEAAELLAMAQAADRFYTAKRLTEDGEAIEDTHYRSCDTAHFHPGDELHQRVLERVLEKLPEINEGYDFDLYSEPEKLLPVVNINKYDAAKEGHIGLHRDTGSLTGTDDRKLSLSVLLNTDFKGGIFLIHDGLCHFPLANAAAGEAAVFPGFSLHCVDPVEEGVRWSMVLWLRGPRFK